MKISLLFIAFILISSYSYSQVIKESDFNFGFEESGSKTGLPDNWIKWGTADYSLKTDITVRHSGSASLLIQSSEPPDEGSFGCAAYSIPAIYSGRKIELRGYMKLQDVKDGKAGLMFRIDGPNGPLQFDNMSQENIHRSSDWKMYSVKLPLPKDARMINIGAILTGTGKLWVDDFQLLIDGVDISKAGRKSNINKVPNNPNILLNPSGIKDSVTLEKVYLHTDRENYYPGDNIWFKAYLVEASEMLLSDHSNNLHVELISPSSKITDSRLVRLDDGLGNGDFTLPDNIHSGSYRLRAYTNYMRNFGDQLFFNKEITIINPGDAFTTFSDSSNYIENKLEISFYPEGGSLVDNVSSIVAFKVVNALGEGCDVKGEVISSSGEKITTLKSINKGMGSFSLRPMPGLRYYAIIRSISGDEAKGEIPQSFKTGIVLNISGNKDNGLATIFKTNKETLPLILDKDLALTLSAHNNVFKTFTIRMKSVNSFFTIPLADIPDGILMLTLAGPDSIPLCERMVYVQNNEGVNIKLETNKKVFQQRDSVSVKISLSKKSEEISSTFLSFSATKNIPGKSTDRFPSNISSWFLLESDVRGPVEEPSYYFDQSNPDRLKDLDLLLLTQGWRDFRWKYDSLYYLPEDGFVISGRVRKKFADVPPKKAQVSIAIFKTGNPIIMSTTADTAGKFYFGGIKFTGSSKLMVTSTGENDRVMGWVLLDSLSYTPAEIREIVTNKKSLFKAYKPIREDIVNKGNLNLYLQYSEFKNSISKKYKLSDTINPGEVTITARRQNVPETALDRSHRYLMTFLPDFEYIVTPHEELFNNLGQLIAFKVFHGAGGNMGGLAYNKPLILLNGMEVGWEGIAYMPIDWIDRFDGLRPGSPAAAAFGQRGRGGVISVTIKTGAPTDYKFPEYHSVAVKLSGYNEPRIFYSPKHFTELENDYKPDLRTTLFWEPYITIENNKDNYVNYFNADNPSLINVTVEGITSTGIPVTGKTEYEVK